MARRKVESFKVGISPSGESVEVEIVTDRKKPYKFTLKPDIHYPTVEDIEEKLSTALTHCVDTYEKVEVNVFKERDYVNINVKDFIDTRFTGVES